MCWENKIGSLVCRGVIAGVFYLSPLKRYTWRTWASYKQSTTQQLKPSFLGRRRNGILLQYSCLENPRDGGAWWAAVHGVAKSHNWVTSVSLSCIGEGNGTPLQCSCLENPRDGGAWWAAVYGVAQSRTRLKRLSSSSSTLEVQWLGLSTFTAKGLGSIPEMGTKVQCGGAEKKQTNRQKQNKPPSLSR